MLKIKTLSTKQLFMFFYAQNLKAAISLKIAGVWIVVVILKLIIVEYT